jgi:hypothetical protein
MCEEVRVEHNLESRDALNAAYKAGVAILGHDLQKSCRSYEDSTLDQALVERLQEVGILPEDVDTCSHTWLEDEEDEVHVEGYEGYANLWLAIAKLGNPTLEFTVIEDQTPSITIGGYGLFGN